MIQYLDHQIQENGKLFRELNNGFKVLHLMFSDKVFGGNPLAIFPEADLLSDDLMQSIASEINYSETVFIQKPISKKNSAKVKIFTQKMNCHLLVTQCRSRLFSYSTPTIYSRVLLKRKMIFEELAGLVYVSPQYAGQNLIGSEIEAPSKFNTSISIPSSVISRCIEIDEKFLVSVAPPVVAGVGLDFVIAEVESYEALKRLDVIFLLLRKLTRITLMVMIFFINDIYQQRRKILLQEFLLPFWYR